MIEQRVVFLGRLLIKNGLLLGLFLVKHGLLVLDRRLPSETKTIGIRWSNLLLLLLLFVLHLVLHLHLLNALYHSLVAILNNLVDLHIGVWVFSDQTRLSNRIPVAGEKDVSLLTAVGNALELTFHEHSFVRRDAL
jgi:hypothetical protein